MRLEELSIDTVSKAVSVYLDLAYGGARPGHIPDLSLPADAGPQEILGLFQREEVEGEGGRACVRYSFRLGNRNYPFMKLVLQEHFVPGEFYFAVDTHDEMEIRPDFPDYEAWMAVRRFNQGLKRRIEAQFTAEGLPTAASLRDVALADRTDAAETGRTILVVDDEEDLAQTVRGLLEARGDRVILARDGREALEKAEESLPDMILLDYELPEMDGLEVIGRLRSSEVTRKIPVLLATAGRISIDEIRKADGFLAKPYQADLLYQMVDRLLEPRES